MKIQLFLSGGGTRGIVFNLGCLAGLASLGALENIRRVRTVSSSALLISLIYKINDGKFPTSEEFIRKNIAEKILVAMSQIDFENLVKFSFTRQLLAFKKPSIHTAISEVISQKFLADTWINTFEKELAWEICTMDTARVHMLATAVAKLSRNNPTSLLRLLCASICLIPKVKPMQIDALLLGRKTGPKYLVLADAGIIDFLGIGKLHDNEIQEGRDSRVADLFIVSDASLPLIDLMGTLQKAKFWPVYKELVRLQIINSHHKNKLRELIGESAFIDVSLSQSGWPMRADSMASTQSCSIGSFRAMPKEVSEPIFEHSKTQIVRSFRSRFTDSCG